MRAIDADELLKTSDVFIVHTKEYGSIEVISVDAVGDAPTIDAVPVVRCEKCLYWKSGENECEKWEYCTFHNIGIGPHSFCSYGKRKEGANYD